VGDHTSFTVATTVSQWEGLAASGIVAQTRAGNYVKSSGLLRGQFTAAFDSSGVDNAQKPSGLPQVIDLESMHPSGNSYAR